MHSLMVCIFDPACELLPPLDEGTILVYSTVAPLLYLLSDLPPPPLSQCTGYTDSVWLWGEGGGVLKCTVDHILQEFYSLFLTRFRTYKIASPPQTKMTSKDDIKGLVSLKFLRQWVWGKLSHEKKIASKVLCQTSFILQRETRTPHTCMPLPMTTKFNSFILRYVIYNE